MPKRINFSNNEELSFYWFGKCARIFRERLGLSQSDIKTIRNDGLTQVVVSRIERGNYLSGDAYEQIEEYASALIDYHATHNYPGKVEESAPLWLYSVVNEGPLFASDILEKWVKDQRLSDEEIDARPAALYWFGKCFKMIRTLCYYNVTDASKASSTASNFIHELESHHGSSYIFTDKIVIKLCEGMKNMLQSDRNFEGISVPEWIEKVQKYGVQNCKNEMREWYILILDRGENYWH